MLTNLFFRVNPFQSVLSVYYPYSLYGINPV
jgi:hypothetical protein